MANETLPETAINSQLSAGIEQKISDLEFYSVEFEDLIGFQPNIAQLRYNNKPGLTLTAGKDCLTVSFNSENNLQEIYPATGFFALYFRTDSRWEIKTVEAYEIDGTALTDAIASGFRIEDEILAPVAVARVEPGPIAAAAAAAGGGRCGGCPRGFGGSAQNSRGGDQLARGARGHHPQIQHRGA